MIRKCATCRYAVGGVVRVGPDDNGATWEVSTLFCHAPGALTAIAPNRSTFPVVGEQTFCYGWRLSPWKLLRRWWWQLRQWGRK